MTAQRSVGFSAIHDAIVALRERPAGVLVMRLYAEERPPRRGLAD